ncbi:MAG: COQ9 family protein [Pseudomonadota bacterium]
MDLNELKQKLLDAALPNVAFDGWSDASFAAATAAVGITKDEARLACPRGAVDLAVAYHARGDALMLERLASENLEGLKFREKVATAVRIRLDVIDDKEAVRRAATLFALPQHAGDSARLVWQTADHIWTALGDTSDDYNWYTKRATLSGVWAATVLYWLGDDTPDMQNTRAFIDRRIEDVMQIEKVKSQVRAAPIVGPLARAAESALSRIKRPSASARSDLPGSWSSAQT